MLCIYCKKDNPKTDEHIIPYSFIRTKAKFVVLSEEVCGDCNKSLGREVDQYFAQETLEGVIRYHHGVRTKDRPRPQGSVEVRLPNDPGLEHWAGAYGWINGVTGNFEPYNQVQILDRETREEILFTDLESLDQLAGTKWTEVGKKLDFKVLVTGNNDQNSETIVRQFQAKLRELIPDFGEPKEEFTAPESLTNARDVSVDMTGRVTMQALRAYSKILFNFAAKYLSYEEIMKPEWDPVRIFVSEGTGKLDHSLAHRTPFWGEETEEMRIDLGSPSFNVRVQNVQGNVVGEVQFYNLVTYKITLLEGYALPRQVAGMFTKNGFYEGQLR